MVRARACACPGAMSFPFGTRLRHRSGIVGHEEPIVLLQDVRELQALLILSMPSRFGVVSPRRAWFVHVPRPTDRRCRRHDGDGCDRHLHAGPGRLRSRPGRLSPVDGLRMTIHFPHPPGSYVVTDSYGYDSYDSHGDWKSAPTVAPPPVVAGAQSLHGNRRGSQMRQFRETRRSRGARRHIVSGGRTIRRAR